MNQRLPLTVAIPTFGRGQVLLDTIGCLLSQEVLANEILILDQTAEHDPKIHTQLEAWDLERSIRWIRLDIPSQPSALNVALQKSTQPYVLMLDDDITIETGFLAAHVRAFTSEDIWAVAGQVLQPGEVEDREYCHRPQQGLLADVDFRFNSSTPCDIRNGMSGNLCVRRERAIEIGGFDENFVPPVSFRFDNELCRRLVAAGGRIRFEPRARIYHLRAARGGTRSQGSHLKSLSPVHGCGDYYFALRCAKGWERVSYMAKRPFREVCTKFHLRHPWWIPVKFLGELRALALACRLYRER